jgi:hypothetical protein
LRRDAWRKVSETLGGISRKERAGLDEDDALTRRGGMVDVLRGGADGWTLGEKGDKRFATGFVAFDWAGDETDGCATGRADTGGEIDDPETIGEIARWTLGEKGDKRFATGFVAFDWAGDETYGCATGRAVTAGEIDDPETIGEILRSGITGLIVTDETGCLGDALNAVAAAVTRRTCCAAASLEIALAALGGVPVDGEMDDWAGANLAEKGGETDDAASEVARIASTSCGRRLWLVERPEMEAGGVMDDMLAGDGEPLAMLILFDCCKLMLALFAIVNFCWRYLRITYITAVPKSRHPISIATQIQSL